jgi:hypothetical protein
VSRRRRCDDRVMALVLTAAVGAGAWMLYDGSRTEHPPQPSVADAFPTPGPHLLGTPAPGTAASTGPKVSPLPPSAPVRIRIPAINLNAPLARVGLNQSGGLRVPDAPGRDVAGWYEGGPAPGAAGNAIVDGHVDSDKGPAVFFLVGALHKGNTIEVDRTDGRAALFSIDAIEVYPKSAFPSARVYGPTADPQLRLITCGGGYNKAAGYLGNIVVYAHLTATRAEARDAAPA